jgi:hypothetical protein
MYIQKRVGIDKMGIQSLLPATIITKQCRKKDVALPCFSHTFWHDGIEESGGNPAATVFELIVDQQDVLSSFQQF